MSFSPPNRGHAIAYRPEIDGIRAFAVLAVVFYHAGFSGFAGGFVGVDVFFVLSGYLISGILLREAEQRRFSVAAFYERRARRILPALTLVCLAAVPFAWLLMLPDELASFGESLAAAALFVPNVFFWQTNPYFGGGPELTPMIHTWSLGIEEQFYFVFPFALILILRFGRKLLLPALLVASVASLAISIWLSSRNPGANFYLLPSRAWELLAGALIMLREREATPGRYGLWNDLLAGLGLAAIVATTVVYDDATPFPGLAALPPVIGTMLLIACAREGTLFGRVLAWKPFVAIGLISYGFYLWHQPVFVFARLATDRLDAAAYWGLIALSALLAWLSYRFVERPLRDRQRLSRNMVFTLSAISIALVAGAGLALSASKGAPGRFPPEMQIAAPSEGSLREGCPQVEDGVHACPIGAPDVTPTIALVGDSHAFALADSLSQILAKRGLGGTLLHVDCHPVAGMTATNEMQGAVRQRECAAMHRKLAERIENGDYEGIVLAIRWPLRLYPLGGSIDAPAFDNGEGGRERDAPFRVNSALQPDGTTTDRRSAVETAVRTYVDGLARIAPVALVYPTPEVGFDPKRATARAALAGAARRPQLSTSQARFEDRNAGVIALLDSIDNADIHPVRPAQFLCDTALPDRCIVQTGSVAYYYDDDHLSDAGAAIVAGAALKQLDERVR